MGLFGKKQKPDADGFYETGISAEGVAAHTLTLVKINGKQVVVASAEGKMVAFDDECPHAAASLSDGELHRWKVICPDHGYCFDVRSGRINWPEDEVYRLKRYEIKVVDGLVKVKV